MNSSVTNKIMALGLIILGFIIAAFGLYVGQTDDAPGAAGLGFILMAGLVALSLKIWRRTT